MPRLQRYPFWLLHDRSQHHSRNPGAPGKPRQWLLVDGGTLYWVWPGTWLPALVRHSDPTQSTPIRINLALNTSKHRIAQKAGAARTTMANGAVPTRTRVPGMVASRVPVCARSAGGRLRAYACRFCDPLYMTNCSLATGRDRMQRIQPTKRMHTTAPGEIDESVA